MKKKLNLLLMVLFAAGIAFFGLSGTESTDTPEPTFTHAPESTATDTPEPAATDTPEPTATNTPEPTATATSTITVTLKPTEDLPAGTTWTNPIDGAAAVFIPAGEFEMGNWNPDYLSTNEYPMHTVFLDSFWMYQTEVTNAQYARCVESGNCILHNTYDETTEANYPVDLVGWQDAQDYCEWAGGSLPTEAQWEKAARGKLTDRAYPWGNQDPTCAFGVINGAQFNDRDCPRVIRGIVPVGSFTKNGYGLYDMAGNLAEWVHDWYDENYYANSPYKNPQGPAAGTVRVVRGGSWFRFMDNITVSDRDTRNPILMDPITGFRCMIQSRP